VTSAEKRCSASFEPCCFDLFRRTLWSNSSHLGRRDIFGIILPGTILVFIGAYALFGVLVLLQLPVKDLIGQQFLLSAVLFVAAYLLGSLLRTFAADDVDSQSGERFQEVWRKECEAKNISYSMPEFEWCMAELAKGNDVSDIPDEFDDWLWRVDKFPYPAWQNRKWQAHGLREVLDFFRDNYRSSMWSGNKASPKSFFNYCKLAIAESGGALADEVNTAEGLTRFSAGTVAAFRLSTWLLFAALVTQVLLVAAWILAPRWGIELILAGWKLQGFFFVFTIALIFTVQWICRLIVKGFRHVRQKEAGIVYHAFYLHSVRQADETARRERASNARENPRSVSEESVRRLTRFLLRRSVNCGIRPKKLT